MFVLQAAMAAMQGIMLAGMPWLLAGIDMQTSYIPAELLLARTIWRSCIADLQAS